MDGTPLGWFLTSFYSGFNHFQRIWIRMGPKRVNYCVFLGPKRVHKVQNADFGINGNKDRNLKTENILISQNKNLRN